MTPRQVDRYKILELLGQGGMGKVYRAFDPHLNREVVLKFINLADPRFDDAWRQRFRREVQAAGSLNHPHIVTIYDVALERDQPYVVMELLSGGTLAQRLTGGALRWPESLVILKPLVEALAYAHQAGIVHRDIKPDNVMFAGESTSSLKLVDFGLARWREREGLTRSDTMMGTPAYMSPEQVRGEVIDGRTDIFALGIMVFEVITGHNPLRRDSPISTMFEVASETQVDLSSLAERAPPEVVNLVERAVAKDRERRYPTCESLLADLEQCLAGQTEIFRMLSNAAPPVTPATPGPDIIVGGHFNLTPEIETVIQTMFHSFGQVAIQGEFGRGYSGSRAFRVIPLETDGRARLPVVIKVAPLGLIRQEWQAYQAYVEHKLPNIARLESEPVLPDGCLWGGLRYALVGGGAFEVQSLHDFYQQRGADEVCRILENRLFRVMGPHWWFDNRTQRVFQMRTDYDHLLPVNLLLKPLSSPPEDDFHLLEAKNSLSLSSIKAGDPVLLKGFRVIEVDLKQGQITLDLPASANGPLPNACRLRFAVVEDINHYQEGQIIDSLWGEVVATRDDLLQDLIGHSFGTGIDLSAAHLPVSARLNLPNPLLRYQALLQEFLTVNLSTIHGDLNMENLLVDPETREISLIDFATVREGHVLHDLLRLETEVLIMLIPQILAEQGLPPEIIYQVYERLHHVTLYPDRLAFPHLPHAVLQEPFRVLQAIRRMARNCLFNANDWQEYYQGLVLYLLGALKFSSLQKLPSAPLPGQVAFWGAATAQYLLETSPAPEQQWPTYAGPALVKDSELPPDEIEPPFGTMRPDSRFYIERAEDNECWEQMSNPYAVTLFVQAPRQMGKSSLLRRTIARAAADVDQRYVFIDFQRFPEQYMADEENFLIELCLMISEDLDIPEAIDRYWTGRRANIRRCSRYLADYIIPQLEAPLILAMDEVERTLTSPFRADFFGMLRTWHNDRPYNESLARLSLFLSSSTEPYLFIDNPNQSPFNVAEVYTLQDFTPSEVEALNRRHGSPFDPDQLDQLVELVGGHPFLTRLALYRVATGKTDPGALFARATADDGPFGDHLSYYLLRVLQKPELKQALTRICQDHRHEENRIFHRLKGSGLIKQVGQQVVLRNQLYTRYFEEHLNV